MSSNKSVKKLKKTDLSITIILLIGIIVVVNFFSYQIFTRLDLTQNKIYSISDVSKNAMANLDDVVNITVYFSNNLPHQVSSLKQEVNDILDEYQNFSKGNVQVEFVSPKEDEQTKMELFAKGIAPLSFQVYEKDKVQSITGYMAIEINYGDNVEIIPAIKRDTSDFEYQITSAIKKVTNEEEIRVGFLSNYGAHSLENELNSAKTVLEELYTLKTIEFGEEDTEILEDINTLIIAGPSEKFSENHLKAINKFLLQGGSVLALLDGVSINTEQGLLAEKNQIGLEEMFGKYGLKLSNNLVLDTKRGIVSFRQGNFPFPVSMEYAFWPKVTNENFNQDFLAVASLQNTVFPWISSVEIDNEIIGEASATSLFTSSKESWVVSENFNLDPNNSDTPSGERKERTLGALLSGKFTNAYPEDEDLTASDDSKLIVVGDSEFPTDGFLNGNPDNLKLFQNLVDSITLDDDLISIRSKDVSVRPINEGNELPDSTRNAIRYFNIFGVTIIVIAFGMIRYYLRRKSNFSDDL